MSEPIVKNPSAKTLIQSIRSIGYSFSTALADIIDNSISAGAKHVEIYQNLDSDNPSVVIFDDGCGMGRNELENAMVIGADRSFKEDSETELGRFGLGLKSASFSQCRRLTVASRSGSHINAMMYDIDEIEAEDSWILRSLNGEEIKQIPCIELLENVRSGTIVVWQKFDRFEEGSDDVIESLANAMGEAKKHIALVFHRFYNDIEISVDGHRIDRRDPFLLDFINTMQLRPGKVSFDGQQIDILPVTLPHLNSMTNEEKALLGGTERMSEAQGLYIYRNKRLIAYGGWMGITHSNEFNKLARVRVDIPSSLDFVWKIDVKKSSAEIPDRIKTEIASAIQASTQASANSMTYKGRKVQQSKNPIWNGVKLPEGKVRYVINQDNPMLKQVYSVLDKKQASILRTYLEKVEQYMPAERIIYDFAHAKQNVNEEMSPEKDELVREVVEIVNVISGGEEDVNNLLSTEAFSAIADRKEEIMEQIDNGPSK